MGLIETLSIDTEPKTRKYLEDVQKDTQEYYGQIVKRLLKLMIVNRVKKSAEYYK